MKRARIFEGKIPRTIELSLELAQKETPIVTLIKDEDAPCLWEGLNNKSLGELGEKWKAWMLLEYDKHVRVLSVGLHGTCSDVTVTGPFIEGTQTIVTWVKA